MSVDGAETRAGFLKVSSIVQKYCTVPLVHHGQSTAADMFDAQIRRPV